MAYPHPALVDLAAGRPLPPVENGLALVDSAVEHRMQGLLRAAVERGDVALGVASRLMLTEDVLVVQSHHRELSEAIGSITGSLASAGLDVALLKGVAAEQRWYDSVGERPCIDIDLLIAPHHLHRVGEVIASIDPDHPLIASVQPLVDRGLVQSIEVDAGGVPVDVHIDAFKLGVPSRQRESIWGRTEWLEPLDGGAPYRVLDPETSLVHFLLHLNKDRFRRLLGFVDVARVIERSDLDWALVTETVRADGVEVPAWLSLEAVRTAIGIDGPVMPSPRGWRASTWRRLWPEEIRLQGYLAEIRYGYRQAWIPMLARGRGAETARWWVQRLVPRPELVEFRNQGVRGRYAMKLLRGRAGRLAQRRRAVAQVHQGGWRQP